MPIQIRNTRQKEAIRTTFTEAGRPLSPEETLRAAQRRVKRISLATIYRNIGSLVEDQWLTPVEIPGDVTRYEVAGKAHHHHFQCRDCSKVYELEGCDIALKPKLPRGFRATGHEFFLYGTCADCR